MTSYPLKHIKDEPDSRDLFFHQQSLLQVDSALPTKWDLRVTGFPPSIVDQAQLGSCGPCEASEVLKFCLKKQHSTDKTTSIFQPSRLFIYYFTRMIDGSPLTEDTGVCIRSMWKAIRMYGAPHEHLFAYDISTFSRQPSKTALSDARHHIPDFQYLRVPQDLNSIKQALLIAPIVFGISIFESFETQQVADTGIVPLPKIGEENLGGHCVALYSYCDETKTFGVMNSWGKNWGQDGWFTIPYAYVLDPELADSFWTIRFFK
jgi:C1A family cysteine protease